jgi:hypothetical protein
MNLNQVNSILTITLLHTTLSMVTYDLFWTDTSRITKATNFFCNSTNDDFIDKLKYIALRITSVGIPTILLIVGARFLSEGGSDILIAKVITNTVLLGGCTASIARDYSDNKYNEVAGIIYLLVAINNFRYAFTR